MLYQIPLWLVIGMLISTIHDPCLKSLDNTCNLIFIKKKTEIDTSPWLKETRGVRDIIEDKSGNLWFSTPDYVAMFNGKELYYFSEDDGLGITGNIHKDNSGIVWVENGFSAFRYDGEGFIEEKIDSILGYAGLWFQRGLSHKDTAYVKPGLYEINLNGTVFHPLPLEEHPDNKYLYFPTTKALLGRDSIIWFGTMEKVFGFRNNKFISIGREEMGRQNDNRQMGIRGIFIDRNENLWIADNGGGVFVYNGRETINFSAEYNFSAEHNSGNTLHRAFSIAEDSEGRIWIGTVYSGTWSYDPVEGVAKNYTSANGVESENIWTIYKTRKGKLLFAGESPGAVYEYIGNKFTRVF